MNDYLLEEGFDLYQTNAAIDGLLRVMKGVVKDADCGICFNWSAAKTVHYSLINFYNLVDNLAVGWPEHSGNRSYPIKQRSSMLDSLWEGEQLALRQDLMRYIMKQLTEYKESL